MLIAARASTTHARCRAREEAPHLHELQLHNPVTTARNAA
jgi:hypothetical protein